MWHFWIASMKCQLPGRKGAKFGQSNLKCHFPQYTHTHLLGLSFFKTKTKNRTHHLGKEKPTSLSFDNCLCFAQGCEGTQAHVGELKQAEGVKKYEVPRAGWWGLPVDTMSARLVRNAPDLSTLLLFVSCIRARPTVGFHMLIKPIFILYSSLSFLGKCAKFKGVGEGVPGSCFFYETQ